MADKKLNTGPEEQKTPEAAQPAQVDPAPVPEQTAAPVHQPEQARPAEPAPGDVVVSFEQINELMAEKRQAARAEVEKADDPPAQEAEAPAEGEEQKIMLVRCPKNLGFTVFQKVSLSNLIF